MLLKLKKNSFFSSVVALTSGTVIAQIVAIIISPIITRLYTPADMGILASLLAITGILGIIATGTYDRVIVLSENETDLKAAVFLSGSISIFIGIIITVVLFFFNEPMIVTFGFQEISKIWVYGIGLIVTLIGFDTILNRLVVRRRQFKVLATTSVIQQLGASGTKVGAGLLGLGANGLLIATVFAYLIRGISMLFAQRNFFFEKKNISCFNKMKQIALRYKGFAFFSSWSLLLNSASMQLPVIMFASFFSVCIAGYYALSHKMLSLPILIIGQNVGQVFLEHTSRVRDNLEELKRITLEIYRKLLLISSIIMPFAIFYSDILFPFVFGSEWLTAGQYAQWISIWLTFQFIASPLTAIYLVLEKQREFLVWTIAMFVLRLTVIYLAFIQGFSDIKMMAWLSIAGALLYLLLNARILYIVQVSLGQIFKPLFVILLPIMTLQYILSILVKMFI